MGYFVLSPIVGTGGFLNDEFDPFRPAAGSHGPFVSVDNGSVSLAWSEANPVLLDADSACFRIPENRLDNTLSNQRANLINSRLATYGAPELVSGGMTVLQALNAIGNWLQPGWVYQSMAVAP